MNKMQINQNIVEVCVKISHVRKKRIFVINDRKEERDRERRGSHGDDESGEDLTEPNTDPQCPPLYTINTHLALTNPTPTIPRTPHTAPALSLIVVPALQGNVVAKNAVGFGPLVTLTVAVLSKALSAHSSKVPTKEGW